MAGSVVLVVGSGGREHSICKQLSLSQLVSEIHCSPGNAGTIGIATNHSVSADDVSGLVELAKSLRADLVVFFFVVVFLFVFFFVLLFVFVVVVVVVVAVAYAVVVVVVVVVVATPILDLSA